jgi:hypothetical protein|tara:strand:- start:75 stop:323 length:249 start_codon:yes stop_codon:yes gene_type:complete
MTLYTRNGIKISRFDDRSYTVTNGKVTYHQTLDKAVLKVAKIEADAESDLWKWLERYENVAERVAADLSVSGAEVYQEPPLG